MGEELSYVYMVRSGESGPVKIGVTDNPEVRLSDLQTANAERLRFLFLEDTDSRSIAYQLETKLHRRFNRYRLMGEWFKCDGEITDAISHIEYGSSLSGLLEAA